MRHPHPPHVLLVAATCFVLGLLCLSLVTGCSLKAAQIAHVGVSAGDLGSTHYAEARGAVERNPILQTTWPMRLVIKGAGTAAVIYLTHKIGREHQTVAKALLTTINLALAGVIVNNVRIAR